MSVFFHYNIIWSCKAFVFGFFYIFPFDFLILFFIFLNVENISVKNRTRDDIYRHEYFSISFFASKKIRLKFSRWGG